MRYKTPSILGIIVASIFSIGAVHAESVPGQLIVRTSVNDTSLLILNDRPWMRDAESIRKVSPDGSLLVINAKPGRMQSLEKKLRRDREVLTMQPNYQYKALFVPNDPSFRYQWNFSIVHAEDSWDFDQSTPLHGGDPSVVIAVIDTGIAYETYGAFFQAPDLAQTHFVAGKNVLDGTEHANDDNGHGTHVTGTIAESTDNGIGQAGIAFETSIMPVKVLDSSGMGTTADIAAGIEFARTHGAAVINLSLGGTDDDPVLHNAIQQATDGGIIVVAATGNDGLDGLYYPSRYDEVISVGAIRYDKTRSYYSNYGNGIDLVAPGGDLNVDQNNDGQPDGILQQTCIPDSHCATFDDEYFEGTSQATPHVTAAIALLLSAGARPEDIVGLLEGTSTDLGVQGYDTTYGWGMLDISSAFAAFVHDTSPPVGSVTMTNDNGFTKTNLVTLSLSAEDAESAVSAMSFSNDGQMFSPWQQYAETIRWDLSTYGGSTVDGQKTVYARFRDAAGNVSEAVFATIIFDHTPPTDTIVSVKPLEPNNRVVIVDGEATSVRQFHASWNASEDSTSGMRGYRVSLNETADGQGDGEYQLTQSYDSSVLEKTVVVYLHVSAEDVAGNVATTTFTYNFQPAKIVLGSASSKGTIWIVDPSLKSVKPLNIFGKKAVNGVSVSWAQSGTGKPSLIAAVPRKEKGNVNITDASGKIINSFSPFGQLMPRGISLAAIDLGTSNTSRLVSAPYSGRFQITVTTTSGKKVHAFWPYGTSYDQGMNVAVGIFTAQRKPWIAVSRRDGDKRITLFGEDGKLKKSMTCFPSSGAMVLSIAAGDVNGDGIDELLCAPELGSSQIMIYNPKGKKIGQFFAFGRVFAKGVQLAVGDTNGDGRDEIVVAPSRDPRTIKIFTSRGKNLSTISIPAEVTRTGPTLSILP